jgi:hypothetical protein
MFGVAALYKFHSIHNKNHTLLPLFTLCVYLFGDDIFSQPAVWLQLLKIFMTTIEAKKFARNKILKGTGIILTILILLLLLGETRGDFANGILFFMEAIANIHTLIILSILFGLTYIFAGSAGEEIIIDKQNIFMVSLKYVIIISIAISAYTIVIIVLRKKDFSQTGLTKIISAYFLQMFLKTGFCLLLVWLWATNKMKSNSL